MYFHCIRIVLSGKYYDVGGIFKAKCIQNPTEHIWKEAKQRIANIQLETFDKTKEVFRSSVTNRKFNYQM